MDESGYISVINFFNYVVKKGKWHIIFFFKKKKKKKKKKLIT